MLSPRTISRWGGLAMTLGGLFWVLKAGTILLVGYQPPLIFEVAPLLFALGLVGLYSHLSPHAGPLGTSGMVVAGLAFVARLAASVYETLPGARVSTGEDFVFPSSLLVLGGTLGIFVSLVLLGIAALRTRGLPPPWRMVPLGVGLVAIPVGATGMLHIELPILLLGGLWMLLGYTISRGAKGTATTAAS